MIKWREADNWSFWADDEHSSISFYAIDRSRRPRMWRLRCWTARDEECVALRIAEGTLRRLYDMRHSELRALIPDIVAAAKAFGLKPRGKPHRLSNNRNTLMETSFVE